MDTKEPHRACYFCRPMLYLLYPILTPTLTVFFLIYFFYNRVTFFFRRPWRRCVKWTLFWAFGCFVTGLSFEKPSDDALLVLSDSVQSQINTGPHVLNEMSHSFMTCVKKLVSCSFEETQISCRKGTVCLTVMAKTCCCNTIMNLVKYKNVWGVEKRGDF